MRHSRRSGFCWVPWLLSAVLLLAISFTYDWGHASQILLVYERSELRSARSEIDQNHVKLGELQQAIIQLSARLAQEAKNAKELQRQLSKLQAAKASDPPAGRGVIFYQGNASSKEVAITIDDAFVPSLVKKALGILVANHATATFFPVGRMIAADPEIFRQAVKDGVQLGNHTYDHDWLTQLTPSQITAQIDGWQEAIDKTLGYHYDTQWFRPPGMAGFTSQKLDTEYGPIVGKYGLNVALWDVDTYTGIYKSRGLNVPPSIVADYVLSHAGPGSVILMHFDAPDIAALPAILQGLKAEGLRPVTLSQLYNYAPPK
ncbi:MAG: polysaccharide deacetylase family protein [Patescibacteria group bacterium]|nr:polysaccharide deacetylase family protein [Patescibacteria group bacterium]